MKRNQIRNETEQVNIGGIGAELRTSRPSLFNAMDRSLWLEIPFSFPSAAAAATPLLLPSPPLPLCSFASNAPLLSPSAYGAPLSSNIDDDDDDDPGVIPLLLSSFMNIDSGGSSPANKILSWTLSTDAKRDREEA